MRIFDVFPKSSKGSPVYKVYYAVGKFRESDYERPWMEFLVDPEGRHCYPITSQKPQKNLQDFFFISKKHKCGDDTGLEYDSWVDVSEKCIFPKGYYIRQTGVVWNELAMEFDQWIKTKKMPEHRNPSSSLREQLENADVFIGPWLYKALGADPVSQYELAAVGAYEDAIKKKSTPEGVCFYDGVRDRIVRTTTGIPSAHWWFRAYADYVWVRYLDDEAKDEWVRMAMKSKNSKATKYLTELYVLQSEGLDINEELTLEIEHRIALSEAVVRTFLDPPEAKKKEFYDFATETFWPFFFIKAQP
jgi:hypothetical protein